MSARPPKPLVLRPSLILYTDKEPTYTADNATPSTPTNRRLYQFSPREVAQELCLIDAELLRRIQPKELEDIAWTKPDKLTRAPNVMKMVHASNSLAQLVPTDVLSESTIPAMARCISAYIKIASKCQRMNNYNSLKAILAGLQCTPLYRLNLTWKEVPSKRKRRFESLSRLMCEANNWAVYRDHLRKLLEEGTPCIPFLGVLLTLTVQHHSLGAGRPRRVSGVEDYTVLEAITIRNRLKTLRKMSTGKRNLVPWEEQDSSDNDPHSQSTMPILGTTEVQLSILNGGALDSVSSDESVTSPRYHLPRERVWSELSRTELDHSDNTVFNRVRSVDDLRLTSLFTDWDWECPIHTAGPNIGDSTDSSQPTTVVEEQSLPEAMRKRSGCVTVSSNGRQSRSSQFSIDIPDDVLSSRRRPSTLLGVLHASRGPIELLSCYQILSFGCSAELVSSYELRALVESAPRNTESINYQLSYTTEP